MKNNNYPVLDEINTPSDLKELGNHQLKLLANDISCLLYTSPSPRDPT
mgnify:CR=1 FL=1